MPPPPPPLIHRTSPTALNYKKRSTGGEGREEDDLSVALSPPLKEKRRWNEEETTTNLARPLRTPTAVDDCYDHCACSEDENLSWDYGYKNLDEYSQFCVAIDSDLSLQLLPSQMFAILKQSSNPSSPNLKNFSPPADIWPPAENMGFPDMNENMAALNYAYTIDHYSHLLSSPEDLPPPPHSSPKFMKKMNSGGYEFGWKMAQSEHEEYLEAMNYSELTNSAGLSSQTESSHSEDGNEPKVKNTEVTSEAGSVGTKPKDQRSASNNTDEIEEKEETKVRRAKRRKISWKRMNPALFQEIFQWETTQPKVKQSQIEKKFNVNRSTYYRWKKKYLAQ